MDDEHLTTDDLLADILAEIKRANRQARLWDVADIADYFKLSTSSVYNRLLCKPEFPKAIKIDGINRRWMPHEVKAYAERHRQRRVA